MMSTEAAVEKVFGLEETRSQIVRHFRPTDIKTMRLVSTFWNLVLYHPKHWQHFRIKLTPDNCRDILQNRNISLKQVSIALDFSTNVETYQDTSDLLSVMRDMRDDPSNLVKKLELCINCNYELEPSQLGAVTSSLVELSSVVSSMEEVRIVFQRRDKVAKFHHNHRIGFILAFLLDSLVRQIIDNESRLRRLDLLGLGMSNIARHRKNISCHIIHLKHAYENIKMETDLNDPQLVKILDKLKMNPN